MRAEFEMRATFHQRNGDVLKRLANDSLLGFFKHYPGDINLKVTVFAAQPGGDPNNLIKVSKQDPNPKGRGVGVPTIIYTEGTQGLWSTIEIVGKSFEESLTVIGQGPYLRKPRVVKPSQALGEVASIPVLASVSSSVSVTAEESEPEEIVTPVQPTKIDPAPSVVTPWLSPRQKLEEVGRGSEIERIRATLASILVESHEGSLDEIPNTLKVPVSVITEAIYGHMKLIPNEKTGTYRGIVAAFYSSTISLFGYKDADANSKSLDENARYSDWILDALLIVDFVGGADKLAHLARERKREVEARAKEEAKPKEPPPTAQAVETVLREGFFKDAAVLEMVAKLLEGHEEAERIAVLARREEEALTLQTENLRRQLEESERALTEANLRRIHAESHVLQFVLPEQTREDIKGIKSRFDALMNRLGI